MLNIVKNTFKHSIIYSFGNVGIKLLGLILIPIYTNPEYLSAQSYGVFALLESIMAILMGILPISMGQSLTRWYWEKDDRTYQKKIFFKTFSFIFLIQILFLIIAMPLGAQISKLVFQTDIYAYSVRLTLLTSSLSILIQQVLHLAKVQQKSILFSSVNILRLFTTLILIYFFIVRKNKGIDGIWEAQLISSILTLLILLPYLIKNFRVVYKFQELPEMLRFGFPFTLAAISGIILVFADRYMLSIMDGLEKTAVYSLGFRLSNTIKIIIATSISFAIAPVRMKMINKPDNLRFFSKNLTYIGFIMMICVLGVSLFALEGLKLLSGSVIYWEANNIIPILSMAIFFGVMKDFSSESMLITKNTRKISLFVFFTGLFNIILNYFLIEKLDIYGAAISTFLSYLLLWILIYRASQKIKYIPYEITKIFKIIVTGSLLLAVGVIIKDFPLLYRLVIKVLLIIVFPIILYWWRFYEDIEIITIKKIIRLWRNPKAIKENLMKLLEK